MKAAKEKLLSGTELAHTTLKNKFGVNPNDRELENAHVRSDELSQNPITGLFLVVQKRLWHEFPLSMKFVWISSVIVGAGIQWTTVLFLYIYFREETSSNDTDTSDSNDNSSKKTAFRLLSALLSCGILFIYVLGEIRRSALTLRHYWTIIQFTFFQYWIFGVLISDILLHVAVAALSVIAIGDQDNISDQLGISLSFFFVLELDEWMYDVFIKDFDVLENDDFEIKIVDTTRAESREEFYHKKAIAGVRWGVALIGLSGVALVWKSIDTVISHFFPDYNWSGVTGMILTLLALLFLTGPLIVFLRGLALVLYSPFLGSLCEKVEEEVLKRKEAWDIINDIYNKHKKIYDKVKQKINCDVNTNNLYKIVGKNVTLQRRYAFMDYDILLKKENIKLLIYCIVVLFVCAILLTLNIFNLVSFTKIFPFYLGIIVVYIFYLVKVVVLDRANRNNINFHKYDFNKPSNSEIKKAKETVEGEKKDGCAEDVYGRVAVSYKQQFDDDVLEDVKSDSKLDAPQCLAYV